MRTIVKKSLETIGVAAPIICLIHCLATPIILTALPFLMPPKSAGGGDDDLWFHWLIIGLCAIAIIPPYLNHRRISVMLLFLAGAACVLVPAYVEVEGMFAHVGLALTASVFLVSANLLNRKHTSKITACCDHAHVPKG